MSKCFELMNENISILYQNTDKKTDMVNIRALDVVIKYLVFSDKYQMMDMIKKMIGRLKSRLRWNGNKKGGFYSEYEGNLGRVSLWLPIESNLDIVLKLLSKETIGLMLKSVCIY